MLTKKEFEVLDLVARGLSNKEIQNKLFIGKTTLSAHINSIYRKLALSKENEHGESSKRVKAVLWYQDYTKAQKKEKIKEYLKNTYG